ncbi:sulfatase [Ideonella sp. DXS29W]|uniref:Sulfatase n=1 Tax=Ideonella lacteola TaxID=2984193 RepID=A0ABU9BN81_9BURK
MGHLLRRVLATAALGLAFAAPAGAKAPNIVFILTDDLDSAAAAQMPLVKSLIADRGTAFRHHYVSLSLCCPSRTTGLRGQFAHNTTIFKNGPPDGGFEGVYAQGLEQSTYATWLQDAGYRTALFGKYLNNYPDTAPSNKYIPPGWHEWMSPVAGTPYKGFKYTMNHNGNLEEYGKAESDYLTDVISREAADFIRRSTDQFADKPFLVYLAPFAPHAPATPAPRHENEFNDAKAPRVPSFNEADVRDKPNWVRSLPLLSDAAIKDIDKLYRNRRRSLLAVDEMVQNIITTLQSVGQLDNTYVIFTSDNGYHQGQHRLDSGKMTAYEEDVLIPMWIRGPGVPVGRTIDYITANVDYAPTFAEIAGVQPPSFVDGRSLMPFLRGLTPPSWRAALLLENKSGAIPPLRTDEGPQEPSDPMERALARVAGSGIGIDGFTGLRVNDGTTYVEYVTGEFELYNNLVDPFQATNSYNTTPPPVRSKLARWIASLKNASGAALRQAELAAPN